MQCEFDGARLTSLSLRGRFAPVAISQYPVESLENLRENANRFTGTVSVKMYLTFRARGDIIKMWIPGRLPQHMCFWICEVYYSQINEPSVAADGSLFTISEPVDDLANQPEDRKYPEQVLKCYMYHLLRDISRRGYTCLPPFRSCGMTGNRL